MSDERPRRMFETWHVIVIVALLATIAAMMSRPCELYRFRVALYDEFSWNDSVCVEQDDVCTCITAGTTDFWIVSQGSDKPFRRQSEQGERLFPEVEF